MGSRILYFIFITSTIYLFLSLPLFADGIFGIAVDRIFVRDLMQTVRGYYGRKQNLKLIFLFPLFCFAILFSFTGRR